MFLELFTRPHIAFDFAFIELFALADDCVVGEMHVLVVESGDVIVDGREPDVALVVYPHGQRVPVSDEHPLPDVELLPAHDQRVLDVLLHHK